jgi:dimeric dUTPase (all-alpha-NTP-PPase superfamily)
MKRMLKFSTLLFLWVYGSILFSVSGYLYLTRSDHPSIIKEINILTIITLFLVEIINQITFYLSKSKVEIASKLKCIMFWSVMTLSSVIFWCLLLKLEKGQSVVWHKVLGVTFVLLLLAFNLPFYSFETNIRFLFLYGKYKKH